MKAFVILTLFLSGPFSVVWADPDVPELKHPWRSVEKILNRAGVEQGEAYKVAFPRTDLNVTVKGIPLEPGMALTSWFAFKPLGKGTLVLGSLVLLDQEVPKVLVQLVRNGFQTTALQNPLLNESPNIKTLYFRGKGSRANLAAALKLILSATDTPQEGSAHLGGKATPAPTSSSIDSASSNGPGKGWSKVEAVLGPGTPDGKLLRYEFSRTDPIKEAETEIPPFMGLSTTFYLQMSRQKLAATGDFAVTAEEVNPVVEVLTQYHITVTAIQSHLLDETPRLFFLHFWALGDPDYVAEGLKSALKEMEKQK